MLKRILFTAVIVLSLLGIGNIDSYSKNTTTICQNYYEQHYIGGQLYIYEYTCDGTLIRIYPAGE